MRANKRATKSEGVSLIAFTFLNDGRRLQRLTLTGCVADCEYDLIIYLFPQVSQSFSR